jgi:hypothetical protein
MSMRQKLEARSSGERIRDLNDLSPRSSRREFLENSAGTIAALAAGAVGATSAAPAHAAGSAEVDGSARRNAKPGDLYTAGPGYRDDEVRGWEGRRVYGVAIGIIQLEANIPMLPGDMGNATTFDFPVLYEPLGKVDPMWVVSSEPHPEVLKRTIEAAKRLELQGVRGIIGNCGFFANYQPTVAKELSVPFFNGPLMQVPMVMAGIRPDQKVGVLTADGPKLQSAPALENCGVTDLSRVVIYGAEKGSEMKNILGVKGHYNPKVLEDELVALARKMLDDHPDVGAIVLECSEFPPHAFAIQNAVHLNVWDFTTLTNWMQAGAVRQPFPGWM